MSEHGLLYRVVRRDIGRKLTALACALILFYILDQQIQAGDDITMIVEMDDSAREFTGTGCELLLVERDNINSVVVDPADRDFVGNSGAKLHVRGPRALVAQLKAQSNQLVHYVTEGRNFIDFDSLEGSENIRDFLGPGSEISIVNMQPFQGVKEMVETIDLLPEHLPTTGRPAGGLTYDTVSFVPPRMTLRGPEEIIKAIKKGEEEEYRELFEEVDIEGKTESSSTTALRFSTDLGRKGVYPVEEEPEATLYFVVRYVVPEGHSTQGKFRLRVSPNSDANAKPSPSQSDHVFKFDDVPDGELPEVTVQIKVPATAEEALPAMVEEAIGQVTVWVRPEDALDESANELEVQLHLFKDFYKSREGWKVVFLDENGDELTEPPKVTGSWVKIPEDGETGTNGGH